MVGAVANVPFADVKIVKMSFRFMSNMDIIVQWATILSPIIAVLIAWWTVRSSAKDTAKKISKLEESTREQIAALEGSTTKQVESVKQLAKILIRTTQIQMNLELKDSMIKERQVLEKRWDHVCREYGADGMPVEIGVVADFYRNREEKDKNLEYESELYGKRRETLMGFQEQLNEVSKELEEM